MIWCCQSAQRVSGKQMGLSDTCVYPGTVKWCSGLSKCSVLSLALDHTWTKQEWKKHYLFCQFQVLLEHMQNQSAFWPNLLCYREMDMNGTFWGTSECLSWICIIATSILGTDMPKVSIYSTSWFFFFFCNFNFEFRETSWHNETISCILVIKTDINKMKVEVGMKGDCLHFQSLNVCHFNYHVISLYNNTYS